MSRIIFPEWRAENSGTNYPFAADCPLTNGSVFIPQGVFVDAILYPSGTDGITPLRLTQVIIAHDSVTFWAGDTTTPLLASGSFSLSPASGEIALADAYGRPAGLLVADVTQLPFFLSWGLGTWVFAAGETDFVATVCVPVPDPGVTGLLLDDGTLLSGEVWLVGDDGVVLRHTTVTSPDPAGGAEGPVTYDAIRIDVVGDPLFRRRLCSPASLFVAPRLLRTITFSDASQTVVTQPDDQGNISIGVNNNLAGDTALRIRQTPDGNVFEMVGKGL